ncbi:class I SAM-dependent methyltransferase [Candidatus Woesearchaeota archaeon]|nr:class I SAM-dependent methyltransferase [Candidatus Woesearchaeota archaeon]
MDWLLASGVLPDPLLRVGSRYMCGRMLAHAKDVSQASLLKELRLSAVATHTAKANEQHYEVPARFFELVLGPRYKYSCCYFRNGMTLADAEEEMLRMTCERAELEDGQRILELGCGWGSLTKYMAEHYPASKITAVSNSNSQREHIMSYGLPNVEVLTQDVNELSVGGTFDRIVSIEMFEHMRNYGELFRWLRPLCAGKMFIHVFGHHSHAMLYEEGWMTRNFFTGGTMPSKKLLPTMAEDFVLEKLWTVNGKHYRDTSDAWLARLDANRDKVLELFKEVYGKDSVLWFNNWRVFFIAVSELFGYDQGKEWQVYHYLFR